VFKVSRSAVDEETVVWLGNQWTTSTHGNHAGRPWNHDLLYFAKLMDFGGNGSVAQLHWQDWQDMFDSVLINTVRTYMSCMYSVPLYIVVQ
jgi:hypothetical protein